MKKALKIFAAIFALLLAGALIALSLARATPGWYQPLAMSAEQREAAAQRAMNKLATLQNAAVQVSESQTDGATTQPGPITISFTDDEINAFFGKWTVWKNVQASYEQFLSDPAIALVDNRLILAGRLKQVDGVASLQFEPRIDEQGQLNLKLVRIALGALPMPSAMVKTYQQQAASAISQQLPAWRRKASISAGGVANASALSAAMSGLLMDMLNQQPSRAVLFLPMVEHGSIPMKVLSVRIENHTLTLMVIPMTPQERAELVKRIRTGESR
jgi:uncharacterized protein YpmS